MKEVELPTFDQLMNPLIQALKELGGSGTIEEINTKVAEILNLTDEQLEMSHNTVGHDTRTEIEYRLAWTRTYLKKYGLLENSGRGVWALTNAGVQTDQVNPRVVKRFIHELDRQSTPDVTQETTTVEDVVEATWRDRLLDLLLNMSPDAFERLAQRLLRELGFIHVEVTGRAGDGGIDGKGIMRLGGLLSFHVIFQCKRYRGTVAAADIRDFRGAMIGRADKGLFITTGNFTRDALREATRDGAPPIDLVDGDRLLDLLKDLELGVRTQKVEIEQIVVDETWFGTL